jgi:type II secretory pathway component PulK
MNEGERQRAMAQQRANQQPAIQVNLTDLLNADKAFDNITQGSSRPVIQNNYTKEEPKTMSDIDISEYLGGTPQRAVQQNNTFYVNMDKTTKALLAEQVKTNKLLGVLVQSVRENGVKIDELPQHIAEVMASTTLPDAEITSLDQFGELSESDTSIDDLLP